MATILTSTQILFSDQGRSDIVLGTFCSESYGALDSGLKTDIASEEEQGI